MRDKDGNPYIKETCYASVNLIPIPFVSIRNRLSDDMLDVPKDPATLMLSLVKEEPSQLTIDIPARKITYKTLEMDVMPARLALYAFFAMQKRECKKDTASCRNCIDCYLDIGQIYSRQDQITELYKKILGKQQTTGMSDSGILNLNAENFNSYKAKIRSDLKQGFGLYALNELTIESVGKRPDDDIPFLVET